MDFVEELFVEAGFFVVFVAVALAAGLVGVDLVVDLADVAGAGDFEDFSSFIPASLASLARAILRREAVFFLIRPFLAALSYSDCALVKLTKVGSALKAFKAVLMSFLSCLLCSVRLVA